MTVISQVKKTMANLQGAQSIIRTYSLHCQDQETRDMYSNALDVTTQIIKNLENRVKNLEFEEPQYKGF